MNSKVHDYIEMFNKAKGNDLARVKHIIRQCSERWDWVGGDSIIADLLDDKNITAEDILEVLHASAELEEGNREFKSAITGMNIALKKAHPVQTAKVIEMEEFSDEYPGTNDYKPGDDYSNLAEAS
ncbi:MAG: hypothetical protein K0Q57_1150 [Gammaproteobacteria bacterium]|jgi:hypothetical protein|nr:hypothetical protein [Gammaproteobacteria bacterium]